MKQNVHVRVAAAVMAAAALSVVPEAAGQPAPLQRQVDSLTGAEIRLYHGERPGKDVRVEIQDPTVLIRKEISKGTSLTTIVSGAERVTLTLSSRGFVVASTGHEEVSVDREHPDRIAAARQLVSSSAAVKKATTLLGKLAAGPESALRHTARVTRAALLSAAGDPSGARELSSWARAAREVLSVRPIALEQGPGQCWYLYAVEAIAAYIEYEDCMAQQSWWEILDMFACAFLYDMRAIGAFSWWVSCVGFRA